MELHETLAQQAFIARQKRRRRMVTICRILLLFILLALWEICARFDIINDFIFSSPSRIILCFLSMVKDGSIFLHTGVTIMETLVSSSLSSPSAFWAPFCCGPARACRIYWSRTLSCSTVCQNLRWLRF